MISFLEALSHNGTQFGVIIAFLGALLIAATIAEKFALKLRLQGSLLIFAIGLIANISHSEELIEEVEHLHQIGLSLLLFYAGLMFCDPFAKSRRAVKGQLILAVLVSLLSLLIGTAIVYGFLISPFSVFAKVKHPLLLAVLFTNCLSVIDWTSFWFLARRIGYLSSWVQTTFQIEASLGSSIVIMWGNIVRHITLRRLEIGVLPNNAHDHIHNYSGLMLLLPVMIGIALGHALYLSIKHLSFERPQIFVVTMGTIVLGYGINNFLFDTGGAMTSLVMGAYLGLKLKSFTTLNNMLGQSETAVETISLQIESINIGTEAALTFLVGLTIESEQLIATIPMGVALALIMFIVRPMAVMAAGKFNNWLSGIRLLAVPSTDSISRADMMIWAICSPKGIIGIAIASTLPTLLKHAGIDIDEFFGIPSYLPVDSICVTILMTMILQNFAFPRLLRGLTFRPTVSRSS
jgi:hypothetical protein